MVLAKARSLKTDSGLEMLHQDLQIVQVVPLKSGNALESRAIDGKHTQRSLHLKDENGLINR